MGFLGDLFGKGQRKDIRKGTKQAVSDVTKGYAEGEASLTGARTSSINALDAGMNQAAATLRPSATTGRKFNDRYSTFMGLNGVAAQKDAYDNFEYSPGFQSKLDFGQKVAERSGAARGYSMAPRMMMELRDYGHTMLGDEFDQYMDRLERGTQRGEESLRTLADMRYRTGAGKAGIHGDYGSKMADLRTGRGATLANLRLGQAQATAGTRFSLGDLANVVGTGIKAYGSFK